MKASPQNNTRIEKIENEDSQILQRYIAFWQNVTPEPSPQIWEALSQIVTPDFSFADPFHHVRGTAETQKMLKTLCQASEILSFEVIDYARNGRQAYLYWRFICKLRKLSKKLDFKGIGRVELSAQGLISSHVDFWDGTHVYEAVPVFGRLVRMVKKRLGTQ